MKKHNNRLVLKYIYGKDISPYKKEDLENDIEFMKKVLRISNNTQLYDNCSESLKKDYYFIKFLIKTFSNEKDFIKKIIKEYISTKDIYDKIDIKILLDKNFLESSYVLKNAPDFSYIYNSYIKLIYEIIKEYNDVEIRTEVGRGFIFIQEEFKEYENILENFALGFIYEIFYEQEITLEQIIHKRFKSIEELEKIGINNFLINYIKTYDLYLANYISNHMHLLKIIISDIDYIKTEWETYINNINNQRIKIILQEIKKFMNSFMYDTSINCFYITYEILKRRNIEDYKEFEKYNLTPTVRNHNVVNINEIRFKKLMNNLIKKLYTEDVILDKKMYLKLDKLGF